MFISPHPLAGNVFSIYEFPQAASMSDPAQDDGFGQLIYPPNDTFNVSTAFMAEGMNEFCMYPWHELYAGH